AHFDQRGGRRPPYDETLRALQPALQGSMPVLFSADSENEVVRALKLADEFHLKAILCGGLMAFKQAALIKADHAPVILALNFGKEPGAAKPAPKDSTRSDAADSKPGSAATKKLPVAAGASKETKAAETENDTPLAALADEKRQWREKVACASELYKQGVLFAFTSRGISKPSEFWSNLRKAVAAGLPEDAALSALTSNPAALFGLGKELGKVKAGYDASITVMTGAFTDPSAKVKYLFIDGKKFQPQTDSAPAGPGRRGPPAEVEHQDR
ncbi:MAG TPA: amidohydrolase family protein, partial [Chthonomonadales bacterium]|nr:amidohydrolase family protein [Chthonomonadales bacterium]